MIQVINGTCAYRKTSGALATADSNSEPLTLSLDEEARLVALGVAEYVALGIVEYVEIDDELTEDDVAPRISMSREELNDIAAQYGIDSSSFPNKAQVFSAIKTAMADERYSQQGEHNDV